MSTPDEPWLALAIGNSHLHWGLFLGDRLDKTWDTPHLAAEQVRQVIEQWAVDGEQGIRSQESGAIPIQNLKSKIQNPPLFLHIASVVPKQAELWTIYPYADFLQLADVPVRGMYSSFGLDRALTLWAAIRTAGSPVLVIDAGTALTFTAADPTHTLIGGAILPGLRLQLESLGHNTAALLPHISADAMNSDAINRVSTHPVPIPVPRAPIPDLPPYWNLNTSDAIASGILHTMLAGIRDFLQDWWRRYPDGSVVMTGGDCDRFYHYLIMEHPNWAEKIKCDRSLIFKGIQAVLATRHAQDP